MRKWINEVPNDGLIHYNYIFNAERLLITSPKALGEVLVQKNYEFIKPSNIRAGLGRLLGVGVLLAEGEEHKVITVLLFGDMWLTKKRFNVKTSCQHSPTATSRTCIQFSGLSLARWS